MSRLGEQLRLFQIGVMAPRANLLTSAEIRSKWLDNPVSHTKVYELSVHLARRINLPDVTAKLSRDERLMAAEIAEQARITILNEVFGEFTGPVREAMMACHNRDPITCYHLLRAILDALTNSKPYENPKDDLT